MPCSICKKTGHNKKTCTFLTNSTKNGQTSVDQTFVAISDRGMFTLDTRLDGKIKTGIEKLYKTKTDFT